MVKGKIIKRIGSGKMVDFKEWKELERIKKQRLEDLALVKQGAIDNVFSAHFKSTKLPGRKGVPTGKGKGTANPGESLRKVSGHTTLEKTRRLFKQHSKFGRLGTKDWKLIEQLDEVHRSAQLKAIGAPHVKMSQKYKPKIKGKKTKWRYNYGFGAGLAAAIGRIQEKRRKTHGR